MEAYENSYKEFVILKGHARGTGVPISTLLRLKDRKLRGHLTTLHGTGCPLSELVDYVAAFYAADLTPQQLRKILQKSDREAWDTASINYRQHRQMKRHERSIGALGA